MIIEVSVNKIATRTKGINQPMVTIIVMRTINLQKDIFPKAKKQNYK